MKNILAFLVLWLFSTAMVSQEFRLSGKVKNTQQEVIAFANVLLLNTKDSTVLKGTSSNEDGLFLFESVNSGDYFLTTSFVQNTSKQYFISVIADLDVGVLTIDETAQNLNEVVVTYQKPKIERRADRLVFNVANTALSEGTIWDLLKHTPTVSDIQGVLTIKGNSDITVMINGRKVNLPKDDIINLLSGTSASNVEAIEVITNPPSKYSAEGGMLIDIKMSKNLIAGYNGAIFNQYNQGVFAKHTVGTDHYFKRGKTALSLNYTFNKDKSITRYTDITNFSDISNVMTVWTGNQNETIKRNRHNISAFLDHEIDDRNSLSFSSINTFNPQVAILVDSKTAIEDLNGGAISSFVTLNDSNQEQLNTSFYADWIRKLKKKGSQFSVGAHYTFYNSDRNQGLETDFLDINDGLTGENNFDVFSKQRINLYSLQTDYVIPIGERGKFETGLRYAGISSRNIILQEGFDRNQPGISPTEAGTFDYDESIYAAYIGYNDKWKDWILRSGLRAEQTESMGRLDIEADAKETSYLNFFPSLSLLHKKEDKHEYTFSYYSRITRPRYDNINPFQYFKSNNVVVEGNPDLLPTISHYLTLGYAFNNEYSIELIYLNRKDKFSELAFQDNEANLLRFISSNLESTYTLGLDFIFNKDVTNFWNSYILATYFLQNITFNDFNSNQLISNETGVLIVKGNQSFTILSDRSLFLDLQYYFRSGALMGNTKMESLNRINFTVRKNIWNKKGSITLGIRDIFNNGNEFSTRQFLDQDSSTLVRRENRLLTFAFRYKFGNTGIKTNKKSKRINERNRL